MNRLFIKNFSKKIFNSAEEALYDLKAGQKLLVGGFGVCGIPENLISEISKRDDINNLYVVSNNAGVSDFGLGILLQSKKIKRMVSSYVGENKHFENQYLSGNLEVELVPQGTIAEKLRCGGFGIPGFFTHTGCNTWVEEGGLPIKFDNNGNIEIASKPKETKEFNGRKYLLEESIIGDFAIIKAWKSDTYGNLIFRKTARNFNVECAMAARVCIAEVEEIVNPGEIDPDEVHLPSIFVHRIIKGIGLEKRTEKIKLFNEESHKNKTLEDLKREIIAKRAAKELKDGMYVNLGIGIPTLVPNYAGDIDIILQAENGMLGIGPYPKRLEDVDPDLVNAGKESITERLGSSYFSSSVSFGMIRGKKLDLTMLGGLQVSKFGDLANFMVPKKMVKGMGGAMDLVGSGSKVIVLMEHVTKNGQHKILDNCSLPLTGKRVISKLITDHCVFDFTNNGIRLVELYEGNTIEMIKNMTACSFEVADDLKTIKL